MESKASQGRWTLNTLSAEAMVYQQNQQTKQTVPGKTTFGEVSSVMMCVHAVSFLLCEPMGHPNSHLRMQASKVQTPVAANSAPASPRANTTNSPSPPPSYVPTRASKLGAKPMSASSFNNGFSSPTQSRPSLSTTTTAPLQPRHTGTSSQTSWPSMQPMQPNNTGSLSSTIPTHAQVSTPPQRPNYNLAMPAAAPIPGTIPFSSGSPPQRPNYNLSLSSITPMTASTPPPPLGFSAPPTLTPMQATPPVMGGLLTPSRPAQTSIPSQKLSNNDWGDFDPLA